MNFTAEHAESAEKISIGEKLGVLSVLCVSAVSKYL
jgi:hypothetical protein